MRSGTKAEALMPLFTINIKPNYETMLGNR